MRRDWGTLAIVRELSYDRAHEQSEFERLLGLIQGCPEQMKAWRGMQEAVSGGEANLVFIDGPAGAGKSTLLGHP